MNLLKYIVISVLAIESVLFITNILVIGISVNLLIGTSLDKTIDKCKDEHLKFSEISALATSVTRNFVFNLT